MIKRTPKPTAPHILPFPEWLERQFPKKTPSRSLLRIIGVLDVAYLIYRLQAKPAAVEQKPVATKTEKPAVEQKPAAAPRAKNTTTKPAQKKPKTTKKTTIAKPAPAEVTLEFHAPADEPPQEPVMAYTPEPEQPAPEPEPLVLERTPQPEPAVPTGQVWLTDERLEDTDIRRTTLNLGVDGISVVCETRDVEDEPETLLTINGKRYLVVTTSPTLNLSRMLQVARVTYGELYVLGRMALGAISGEGYIAADEAARVVRALRDANGKAVEMNIEYYTKDKTARSRTAGTVRIRFEPA